tara:strand:+ start:12513 stop:13475 length:963 start_codon:yes stop_codon:yes gene_type:complete
MFSGSSWQLRWATEADTEALLDLFSSCFGSAMSREEWAWKYRYASSPGVVCLDGDAIVAFNGGMPRAVHLDGRCFDSVQMGDVMVDPRYRGILTRRGPFFQVVNRFFSEKVGDGLAYRYAFGFPHARHTRLGRALKLYCETDHIVEANWHSASMRRWRSTAVPLQAQHASGVTTLWHAMAKSLTRYAVGVRDWSWLEHRYLNAPERGYLCWWVVERLTKRPLGVCVLRQHSPQSVELLDIVAPLHTMSEVVHCARHITARLGAERLTAWLTPSVAHALESTGFELSRTEVVVPGSQVNGMALGMEPSDRWWLMGGDTDFR